jgi:hypothetical protein
MSAAMSRRACCADARQAPLYASDFAVLTAYATRPTCSVSFLP